MRWMKHGLRRKISHFKSIKLAESSSRFAHFISRNLSLSCAASIFHWTSSRLNSPFLCVYLKRIECLRMKNELYWERQLKRGEESREDIYYIEEERERERKRQTGEDAWRMIHSKDELGRWRLHTAWWNRWNHWISPLLSNSLWVQNIFTSSFVRL